MEDTALLLWIVTITGGASLALLWLVHGGAKRAADVEGPPPASAGRPTPPAPGRSRFA